MAGLWILAFNGVKLEKKVLLLILAGLMIGTLLGSMILITGTASRPGPVIGTQVDDFSLPGLQNQTIQLSQYRGKAVILNFWATWCVPCKDEMLLLQKYSDQMHSLLVVIGINSSEQAPDVAAFVAANQIKFPIALDLSGEITRKFMINGYPTSFFVDAKGILRDEHIGALRDDLIRGYLQAVGVAP